VFIERANLATQLHMFCLFPLTEQDIHAFVVQINPLLREPFAVPMHNGNDCQQQRVDGERPNTILGFDTTNQAIELASSLSPFSENVFAGNFKEQRHPVAEKLPPIVFVEGLDITAGKLSLQYGITGIGSDAGRHHKAVFGEPLHTVFQKTTHGRTALIRWDFIKTIKQQTTAPGLKELFEVIKPNLETIRCQALCQKLDQHREMNAPALLQEV
jgi:hypothetical protein